MKVLLLGDLFVTCDMMQKAVESEFGGSGFVFEFARYTDRWPAEPLQQNDEVREFVGDESEIAGLAPGAEIILTHSAPVTRRVLDAAGSPRVVGAARGGPVNINIALCTERKIPVVYAAGSKGPAVAEFTVGLMLAETRNIVRSHMSMVDGKWRGDLYVLDKAGFELGSAVVGIVGLGAIGGRVAEIVRGFGSVVLAYDPMVPEDTIEARGFVPATLDDLLRRSDVVSLHARATAETRGMLGEREIGLMKPSAFLVNTSRAELVDQKALVQALTTRKIAGAALDVFEAEPLPSNHPLAKLDNVTLTSHLGGASVQAAENGARIEAGQVGAVLWRDRPPRFCANPQVLAG